jgi:hypothetical protein
MILVSSKIVDSNGCGKHYVSAINGTLFPATFEEIKLLNKGDENVRRKFQRLVSLKNEPKTRSSDKAPEKIFWTGK